MSRYYTFVGKAGDKLYHRYIENGERHIDVISNYPYKLFSKDPAGKHISLYNDKLICHEFDTIYDMADFVRKFDRDKIYGNTSPVQQFIANEYNGKVDISEQLYRTLNFDLEVEHGEGLTEDGQAPKNIGFPKPEDADGIILSVTYEIIVGKEKPISYGLGLKPYTGDKKIKYTQCKSEKELLTKFIDVFVENQFDFLTGWSIQHFDIPYLVNRCRKVLGNSHTNKLSPFGGIVKNPIKENPRSPSLEFEIFGSVIFDYIELYKKYAMTKQESYKLDHIAEQELGDNKVKFPEYNNNLMNLYQGVYNINGESKDLPEKDRWCKLRTLVGEKLGVKA